MGNFQTKLKLPAGGTLVTGPREKFGDMRKQIIGTLRCFEVTA